MRKFRRFALGAPFAFVALLSVHPSVQGSSSAVQAEIKTQHILQAGSGYVAASEKVNADGTVTDTWVKGPAFVRVTGSPGQLVEILPNGVRVTLPPVEKSDATARQKIEAYRAAGRSPENDWKNTQPDLAAPRARSEVRTTSTSAGSHLASSQPAGAPIYESGTDSYSSPDGKVVTTGVMGDLRRSTERRRLVHGGRTAGHRPVL